MDFERDVILQCPHMTPSSNPSDWTHTNISDNLGFEKVVDKSLQFQQKLTGKYCSEKILGKILPNNDARRKECRQQGGLTSHDCYVMADVITLNEYEI